MQLTQIASVVERQLNSQPPLHRHVVTMHPAPGQRRLMTYAIRVVTGPHPINRTPLFGRESDVCTICGRDHVAASCPSWKDRAVQKSRSVGMSSYLGVL